MPAASETQLLVDTGSAASSVTSFASPSMFSNLEVATSNSENLNNAISNSDGGSSVSTANSDSSASASVSASASAGAAASFNSNSKLAYLLTSVLLFPVVLSSF